MTCATHVYFKSFFEIGMIETGRGNVANIVESRKRWTRNLAMIFRIVHCNIYFLCFVSNSDNKGKKISEYLNLMSEFEY